MKPNKATQKKILKEEEAVFCFHLGWFRVMDITLHLQAKVFRYFFFKYCVECHPIKETSTFSFWKKKFLGTKLNF
jgi:hypothetical protein